MADIFISYRRDGGESLAHLVHDRLQTCDYDVFLDVESLRSGKFNEALYREIELCTDFVLILSPGALERCINEGDWLRLEIECAKTHRKNIIPVIMRNFKFPAVVPESLDDLLDYNGLEVNMEYLDAVIQKLRYKRLNSKPRDKKEIQETTRKQTNTLSVSPKEEQMKKMISSAYTDARHNEELFGIVQQAEMGDANALSRLGDAYFHGRQVGVDRNKAVYWLYMAAEHTDDPYVMYLLGRCYYEGTGVMSSYVQALHWYKKSAQHPSPYKKAMIELGNFYREGIAVSRNVLDAAYWYHEAMKMEDVAAATDLSECMGTYQFMQLLNKSDTNEKEILKNAEYSKIQLEGVTMKQLNKLILKDQTSHLPGIALIIAAILLLYTLVIGLCNREICQSPHCYIAVGVILIISTMMALYGAYKKIENSIFKNIVQSMGAFVLSIVLLTAILLLVNKLSIMWLRPLLLAIFKIVSLIFVVIILLGVLGTVGVSSTSRE